MNTIYYLRQPTSRGSTFSAARDERWRQLCAEAANEQDPKKLQSLIEQILELFESSGSGGQQAGDT
jgi:hypothetical protein